MRDAAIFSISLCFSSSVIRAVFNQRSPIIKAPFNKSLNTYGSIACTLFNSLTKAGAESANYPFCTIDPNVGIVAVPDERLKLLGDMYQSKKVTPATIEFVDIAGLVKGASKGEGLGNQFLSVFNQRSPIIKAPFNKSLNTYGSIA